MSTEQWITLAGIVINAIVLIVVALIQRNAKRNQKRADARAARRERESRLSMDMMAANMELADVTAIALSGGKINGNVEAARAQADKARKAYDAFLRDEAAHAVAKQ